MIGKRFWSWTIFALASVSFLLPLVGMLEFSLRARRGVYSLDAYRNVLSDPQFHQTLGYSLILSLATVVLGVLIGWRPANRPRRCWRHERTHAHANTGPRAATEAPPCYAVW